MALRFGYMKTLIVGGVFQALAEASFTRSWRFIR